MDGLGLMDEAKSAPGVERYTQQAAWGSLLTLLLWAVPGAAQAHLVNSGLGPFYDGALHLLLSPADLLGVVALALWAGLRGTAPGRLTAIAMPAAWLLAGLIALLCQLPLDLPWLSVLSFTLLGALLAANLPLGAATIAWLAATYGALVGLLNGSALAAVDAGWPALLGIVVTAFLLTLLLAATVVPLRAGWERIAVRVVGSWVSAIGILMFGWLLQGALA